MKSPEAQSKPSRRNRIMRVLAMGLCLSSSPVLADATTRHIEGCGVAGSGFLERTDQGHTAILHTVRHVLSQIEAAGCSSFTVDWENEFFLPPDWDQRFCVQPNHTDGRDATCALPIGNADFAENFETTTASSPEYRVGDVLWFPLPNGETIEVELTHQDAYYMVFNPLNGTVCEGASGAQILDPNTGDVVAVVTAIYGEGKTSQMGAECVGSNPLNGVLSIRINS